LTIEYDSAKVGSPAIHEIRELWNYRDLLMMMITNSIKTRYKRSSLGVIWTLLNPLLQTLVLTIAFSQLMRFRVANYPIYLLSGLIVWSFFSQTILQSMNNLIWGSSMMKRIYIPRTVFTLSVLGNSLVNFFLTLIPLIIIMLFVGQPIQITFVLLPFAIILLAMLTLGFSLIMSTIAVYFADVVNMFSVVLTAWYFLTPIIYPISVVPEQFLPIIKLNPMYWMIEIFRALIYYGEIPSVDIFVWAFVISVTQLIFGWWFFTKKADEFAYRI
jgi:ABC-type polysaccharide/polyol phosphate export permease